MDTAKIITNPQALGPDSSIKKPDNKIHKVIFIILGVVVLLEVIIVLVYFNRQSNQSPIAPAQSEIIEGASFSLSTTVSRIPLGSSFDVDIRIDTAGKLVDGADVILRFDPTMLEASASGFIKGVFNEYPQIQASNNGQFIVSGISGLANPYMGSGIFGTVRFIAKKPGSTEILFDYSPGSTIDSNITQNLSAEDILRTVNSLKIDILP